MYKILEYLYIYRYSTKYYISTPSTASQLQSAMRYDEQPKGHNKVFKNYCEMLQNYVHLRTLHMAHKHTHTHTHTRARTHTHTHTHTRTQASHRGHAHILHARTHTHTHTHERTASHTCYDFYTSHTHILVWRLQSGIMPIL